MYNADADEDYYYAQDHLYSPTALLDDSGAVVERIEYNAYGEADVTIVSGSGTGNEYLFTGRRLDILDGGSLKIYYCRNRYYDPHTGRFLTHDPMRHIEGMNLYEYVQSNPIEASDPLGLASWGELTDHEYQRGRIRPPWADFLDQWNAEQPPWRKMWSLAWSQRLAFDQAYVADGYLPLASDYLMHYLDNTGTTRTFDFERMIRESDYAKHFLAIDINKALEEAEELIDANGPTAIVGRGYRKSQVFDFANDWNLAVQTYYTNGLGAVHRSGCCYVMYWTLVARDNYEFEDEENSGGLVSDHDMWELNHYGYAQHFRTHGSITLKLAWPAGRRIPLLRAKEAVLQLLDYGSGALWPSCASAQ